MIIKNMINNKYNKSIKNKNNKINPMKDKNNKSNPIKNKNNRFD